MSDSTIQEKRNLRQRRKRRIRIKVFGETERPRLSVYRSLNHIYAQVIDDSTGKTIAAASTLSPELKDGKGKKKDRAKEVGKLVAQKCKTANVGAVCSIATGSTITAASPPSPTAPARAG